MIGGRNYKLLIVDDNPAVRRALRRLFESEAGWTVIEDAINGADGILKAQQFLPDAIIVDMSMPGMTGLEAARELKTLVPEASLFMFTNFAEDAFLKDQVSQAGVSHLFSKSDPSGLLSAVKEAFAHVN